MAQSNGVWFSTEPDTKSFKMYVDTVFSTPNPFPTNKRTAYQTAEI